jgi:carbon-monoxide dehydrogenase small subunit
VTVNGSPRSLEIASERLLIDVLREDLGLTGTKRGCSIGVCGACSVTVDGELISACLYPAVFADGAAVGTVEGLAEPDGRLSPVQNAFIENGGFQCGICTPGQLVAATALLSEQPRPTEAEIRSYMTGNLCRCTGYQRILRSIEAAAAASGNA